MFFDKKKQQAVNNDNKENHYPNTNFMLKEEVKNQIKKMEADIKKELDALGVPENERADYITDFEQALHKKIIDEYKKDLNKLVSSSYTKTLTK